MRYLITDAALCLLLFICKKLMMLVVCKLKEHPCFICFVLLPSFLFLLTMAEILSYSYFCSSWPPEQIGKLFALLLGCSSLFFVKVDSFPTTYRLGIGIVILVSIFILLTYVLAKMIVY